MGVETALEPLRGIETGLGVAGGGDANEWAASDGAGVLDVARCSSAAEVLEDDRKRFTQVRVCANTDEEAGDIGSAGASASLVTDSERCRFLWFDVDCSWLRACEDARGVV